MRTGWFRRLLLVGTLAPQWSVGAVSYEPTFNDPILEPWRWSRIHALGDLDVITMDEGPDGRMWFGGVRGLANYDGRQVRRIPIDNDLLPQLTPRHGAYWVQALLVPESGQVVALVGQSLVAWSESAGEWSILIRDVGPAGFEAKLETGPNGDIWLLTGSGLWQTNPELTYSERVLDAGTAELRAFCLDVNGDVWLVEKPLRRHLRLLHIPVEASRLAEESERTEYFPKTEGGSITTLLASQSGLIWYADNAGKTRLLSLNPTTGEWTDPVGQEAKTSCFYLHETRDGTIWATGSGGLFTLRQGLGSYYPLQQLEMPAFRITHIIESASQKLWMCGRFGPIYTLDRSQRQWLSYSGLQFHCDTKAGIQWFLHGGEEVISQDPSNRTWQTHRSSAGMIEKPLGIFASSHGLIWVVGKHMGRAAFCVFDGKEWMRFELPQFANQIKSHFETADGTIWMGAGGPMLRKEKDAGGALQYRVDKQGGIRLLEHRTPPAFPYHVNAFAETPDGTLWLGRPGLYTWRPGQKEARAVESLPGVASDSILADESGAVWVAQTNYGIHQKVASGWKRHSTKDGLAMDNVSRLLLLNDQTLLASSGEGISRFDGARWTSRAFSKTFSILSSAYGNMRQARDDALWFNYDTRFTTFKLNGESHFLTIRYRPDANAPETWIGEGLETVSQPGNVHLAWNGRDFWENCSTDQLEFSYRLNNEEWSPFTDARRRTFLNLPGGNYRLEVRARDRDFNVDPTPASFSFSVEPPLWARPWFIAMNTLILGGAIALVWQFLHFHDKRLKDKQQHLIELDRQKTNFFSNVSHELNTPLTSAVVALRRIQRHDNSPEIRSLLDLVVRNVERMSTLVRELLNIRKLEQADMKLTGVEGDLVAEVRETVELLQPMARANQVTCVLGGKESLHGWYDADKLMTIVQNLVTNAIKYTPEGGTVRMKIDAGKHRGAPALCLDIEDTGRGIAPEQLQHIFERFYRIPAASLVEGSGIGLNLTHELVTIWGGSLDVESPIHKDSNHPGTRFRVMLPIGPEAFNAS